MWVLIWLAMFPAWIATLATWEVVHFYVNSLMSVQVTRVREGLVTWFAEEGLHSWVAPLVFLQVVMSEESLVTLQTYIQFLSSVSYHVHLQITWLTERLFTVVAWERNLSRMNKLCAFRWLAWEKDLPQALEDDGLSPVWILLCALSPS